MYMFKTFFTTLYFTLFLTGCDTLNGANTEPSSPVASFSTLNSATNPSTLDSQIVPLVNNIKAVKSTSDIPPTNEDILNRKKTNSEISSNVQNETKSSDVGVNPNIYRLRPRDFIRILVINESDTQIERRINSDGTVDIPFLKKIVPVAGLTLSQAQDRLVTEYLKYFKKPQVSISIVTYAERRIYVTGYVGKPGAISIPPEEVMTLGRALSIAGGILPRGSRSDVKIKRIIPNSTELKKFEIDVRRIDSGKDPDFLLEDDDQIYVADSQF